MAKDLDTQKAHLQFEAIGTAWTIDLDVSSQRAASIAQLIADRISQFDQHYSRFRSDSWVTHIGTNPGKHPVPDDFADLYNFYESMYQMTNGLVTPLIGDAMERAGYNANYDLRPKQLKKIPALSEVLEFSDNTLHVKYSCILDFGAAGKGYLVDLIGQELDKQGIQNYIIDAGGDILHHSPTPTPVGLESPDDTQKVLGIVNLQGSSLCGSAGNKRKWGKYHHIMNPQTLQSQSSVKAAWVISDTAMVADGLATCLFFVPATMLKGYNFEYLCILEDNVINVSKAFPGKATNE